MTVLGQILVERGITKGIAKGIHQGENWGMELVRCLLQDGRMEDIELITKDPEARKRLYQEYHIGE